MKENKVILLDKKIGETPLECLERFRVAQIESGRLEYRDIPMTYAGRLDPMASGKLLILIGEECKNKEQYLGLDKEYDVEILFGVETDTQDILGIIGKIITGSGDSVGTTLEKIDFQKYVGKFSQPYPAYSSKTIDGKQLHTHAREGTLPNPDKMPTRNVEIYSIEIKNGGFSEKKGKEIADEAIARISKVTGDFRQKEVIDGWNNFIKNYGTVSFKIIAIRVSCSGGTYMRSLAERIGYDIGTGAIAYSIHRTKIGEY